MKKEPCDDEKWKVANYHAIAIQKMYLSDECGLSDIRRYIAKLEVQQIIALVTLRVSDIQRFIHWGLK